MSQLSEKVRNSLFAAMNVAAVTDLATGGIHNDVAPEGAARPYVIFSCASNVTKYTYGFQVFEEESIWFIKAMTDKDSIQTKEPQALAEEIIAACISAIGGDLPLTGGSQTQAIHPPQDLPHFTETLTDRTIYTRGARLKISAKP